MAGAALGAGAAVKLWLLRAMVTRWDYMEGCVVRAEDETAARALAAEDAGDEGPEHWLTEATCEEITADGEPGLLIMDFHEA